MYLETLRCWRQRVAQTVVTGAARAFQVTIAFDQTAVFIRDSLFFAILFAVPGRFTSSCWLAVSASRDLLYLKFTTATARLRNADLAARVVSIVNTALAVVWTRDAKASPFVIANPAGTTRETISLIAPARRLSERHGRLAFLSKGVALNALILAAILSFAGRAERFTEKLEVGIAEGVALRLDGIIKAARFNLVAEATVPLDFTVTALFFCTITAIWLNRASVCRSLVTGGVVVTTIARTGDRSAACPLSEDTHASAVYAFIPRSAMSLLPTCCVELKGVVPAVGIPYNNVAERIIPSSVDFARKVIRSQWFNRTAKPISTPETRIAKSSKRSIVS